MLVLARAVAADDGDSLGLEVLADALPSFTLLATDGGAPLSTGDLRGKTVLLHFWATWCTPCKDELPALDGLATQLDNQHFAVVLAAIDNNVPASQVQSFARGIGVRLPIYLANERGISNSFWAWGVPVSYLIDGQGHFIGRLRGPRPWDQPALRAALLRLVRP